jgi:hypothetical protein
MVIQEGWIGGVSTRRVDELVQAMGLSGISKSQSLPRRRPGSPSSAKTSMSGSAPSSTGQSRANGHISGSMPPTSRYATAVVSSR